MPPVVGWVIAVPGWNGSNRRERLPDDWDRRREERLRYDGYQCTWENVYE